MKKILLARSIALVLAAMVTFVAFWLFSCGTNSPLSDVILTKDDAKLLTVSVKLQTLKLGLTDSVITEMPQQIYVYIYDKNSACVGLKDGGVTMNTIAMKYFKNLLGFPGYYLERTDFTYPTDSVFSFTIQLGDKSEFDASISVSGATVLKFSTPDSVQRSDSLAVSWTQAPIPAKIYITKFFSNDTLFNLAYDSLDVANIASGTYVFAPSLYLSTTADTAKTVHLKLSLKKTGTIDTAFKSKSSTLAVSEIRRKVVVH
ncbi:MAG: hypothetical protein JW795_14140 [Chitinivibrionales bacterium]|nr:hypothetical protein [Chitinivibrionales bacterium]